METVLATREWIATGGYSLADISNAAIIVALRRRLASDPIAAHDRVRSWFDRVTARPAWKSALAE
jgi:glutathione S-transferase